MFRNTVERCWLLTAKQNFFGGLKWRRTVVVDACWDVSSGDEEAGV